MLSLWPVIVASGITLGSATSVPLPQSQVWRNGQDQFNIDAPPTRKVTIVLVDSFPRPDVAAEVLTRRATSDGEVILLRRADLDPSVVFLAEQALRSSLRRIPNPNAQGTRVFIHAGPRLPVLSPDVHSAAVTILDELRSASVREVAGIGKVHAVTVELPAS